MIEDHWKPKLLLSLLPFLFLGVTLLPKECHGQAGGNGNFFYYYSPTQRTNINHGLPTGGPANFFNNPFLNQQKHPQMTQHVPNQQLPQPPQPQPQSSMQFPSFQQSSLLGFNHPNFQQQQTQQSPAFQQSAPSQFQFPSMQPTPATQQPQHQFLPQTSPTFSTFTRFGPNAQFFGSRNAPIPQPSQSPFFPTQSPLGTVAPGEFNFFQSPFQYLQQRFLQDTTSTPVSPTLAPVPAMHSVPTAPTTTAVPPSPPAPTPTQMMMDSPPLEQVIETRPKFSSRFRYVQQPPLQQHQYNPYTRLGSPYTSDLPYMEQRFYSSPTSPTGYAFSLGGDQGSGATSTVHFSMGPLNKINQYLTEVSATRRLLQRQSVEPTTIPVQEISVPETTKEMVAQDEEVVPQEVPSSPEPTMSTTVAPSTTTEAPTSAPSSPFPEPMPVMEEAPAQSVPESMNSTLEPLLNEPSLQTETITAPVVQIEELPTARKASETSIPKRLVIRKKVARKRLRLDGSGEMINAGGAPMPVGVMIRRIVSSNRLPTEETKVLEDDGPKGFIAPIPASTPSTTTTTTTTEAVEPEQMANIPEMQPEGQHDDQLSQELPVEPQQSSSPQPMMMPVEESHMMTMTGNQEEPQEPMQPMIPVSSTTTAPSNIPEEMPAMLESEQKEMPQVSEEMMSKTTATPIQPPPVESLMSHEPQPVKENDAEEYFEDYYEDDDAPLSHPHSEMPNPQGHSRIMTAVKAPESDDELPILNGVQKDDFPGVFHPNSSPLDNSVETDQGEVITRITSSHPSESAEVQEVNMPAPESSPMTMTVPQNSTTESNQPEFMREDPQEEQPPKENEVPATPAFQPTSEASVPMMTTTPTPMMMSSTTPQEVISENSSQEQEDESLPMQPEDAPLESSSSTTEQPEGRMEQMAGTAMSTSTEANSQQGQDQEMTHEEADLPELMSDPVMSVSSTTESIMMSSNADEDSTSMPQMELANPSSTEILSSSTSSSSADNDEMVSGSSTTTVAPPSRTTETSSQEQLMNVDDSQSNNSQENYDESSEAHQPNSEEQALDSEEIGKVQRLALEETLKRLRERQQSSSTSDPSDDGNNSPENDVQIGRKMFSRRPLQVSNLPLPTSGPVLNKNAVLHEDEGVDRSQVVEKIQRFRAKYGRGSSTTTKKPRRVTRPSPSTERRLAVVSPVEDLVGSQEQVDSFSDSSSTPGAAVDVTFTTTEPSSTTPMPYRTTTMTSFRTTPSSTTTMVPLEESSTTSAPILDEEEVNYPTYSTTTTESYEQQTTRQPPPTLTTRMTESTTLSSNDEFSSTTETDIETITERMEPATANDMTSSTTTTTESSMMMTMTTTPPPALMESATTPSTTTSTTTFATMTDFSDDNKDNMPKNDYDVFYSEEENLETAKNIQVSSSTETSVAAAGDDDDEMDSSSPSSPSSTTISPLSTSTDTSYVMTTTSEPNSGSAATTTMNPDMMTTTSAGQLIIHEILPTMPPLKEVSFVIGESVEDDQSAAVDNISKAETSDELLEADKAVVRVEANVHVLTSTTTDFDTSSSVEQSSEELTPTQQPPLNSTTTSGEQGQRRVRIVVKRQRRLRRPSSGAAGGSGGPGRDGRRRRRKVYHRRPQ